MWEGREGGSKRRGRVQRGGGSRGPRQLMAVARWLSSHRTSQRWPPTLLSQSHTQSHLYTSQCVGKLRKEIRLTMQTGTVRLAQKGQQTRSVRSDTFNIFCRTHKYPELAVPALKHSGVFVRFLSQKAPADGKGPALPESMADIPAGRRYAAKNSDKLNTQT